MKFNEQSIGNLFSECWVNRNFSLKCVLLLFISLQAYEISLKECHKIMPTCWVSTCKKKYAWELMFRNYYENTNPIHNTSQSHLGFNQQRKADWYHSRHFQLEHLCIDKWHPLFLKSWVAALWKISRAFLIRVCSG